LAVPGINVNKGNSYGWTPLLFATKQKNEEIVDLLLQVPGIDVNKGTKRRNFPRCDKATTFPLLEAVRGKHAAIVRRLLLAPGLDINQHNECRTSAYAEAYSQAKRHPTDKALQEILALLSAFPGIKTRGVHLFHVENPYRDSTDAYGYEDQEQTDGYQLLRAVTLGHHDVVANLLKQPNVDVNLSNVKDFMVGAVTDGDTHKFMVNIIGKLCSNVSCIIRYDECKYDPCFTKVRMCDGRVVRRNILTAHQMFLVRRKVTEESFNGCFLRYGALPPLAVAVLREDVEMVRLLVAYPTINVNYCFLRNDQETPELGRGYGKGYSLLHIAYGEIKRLLLTHPDVDEKMLGYRYDVDGPVPISVDELKRNIYSSARYASEEGNLEEFKRLVESPTFNRARLHDGKYPGTSAFWLAVANGRTPIVEYLLDTLTLRQKNRGIHAALVYGHSALVKLFLLKGANINALLDGCTALSFLCNPRSPYENEGDTENLEAIHKLLLITPERQDRKDVVRLDIKDREGKTALDVASPKVAFLVEKHVLVNREMRGLSELVLFTGTATGRAIPQLPSDLERLIGTYLLPVRPEGVVIKTLAKAVAAVKISQRVDRFLEEVDHRHYRQEMEQTDLP
jgi:hypothetical protein